MSVTAIPSYNVGGLASGGALDSAASEMAAIDKLSITWGRGGVLEATSPATASVVFLDRTKGAAFARQTNLVGKVLELTWDKGEGGFGGYNFRGRITDVDVRPWHGDGGDGFRISVAASSLEIDLANHRMPSGSAWPAETFAARLTRIRAAMPARSPIAWQVWTPTRADAGLTNNEVADPALDFGNYPAAAIDVSGQDMLTILRQHYASLSQLPMIYNVFVDRIDFAARRTYAYNPIGYTPYASLTAYSDRGNRYVTRAINGLWLDAEELEYDAGLTQPIDSRITRAEVGWLDPATTPPSKKTVAAVVGGVNESSIGRRTLAVDTIHSNSTYAAQLGNLYARTAGSEGALPRLDTLVIDTDRFPTAEHRDALLAGYETSTVFFLGRSWLTRLGYRPMIGILGGTIAYAEGRWRLELTPAPVNVDLITAGEAPVTVATAAKSTVRLADLDPSVTFGDAAFIQVGAGYTTANQPPLGGPTS